MGVFWYYCKNCRVNFSWVFTGENDCKHCVKCGSDKIVRVKGLKYYEMLKNINHK